MPAPDVYDSMMEFPILIGDIGGTHARFAMLVDANSEPKPFPVVKTADHKTIEDAIQSAILDQTALLPRSAVLAVAGPVEGDEIQLTNCNWIVGPKVMHDTLGFADVLVLNDFEAQALAVVALDKDSMEQIGGGEGEPYGSRVVLGPGTGLGTAGLICWRKTWIPVPGEGGHIDVGPRTDRDAEIWPNLEPIEGRISGEQLVCGNGLLNIYRAIAKTDGTDAPFSTPAEISTAGLEKADQVSSEALALFVTIFGRVAGDLALVFMARGGVFLTGGIAQKIIPALKTGAFRAAFEDKAPHRALLEAMPIHVVSDPMAALAGLSAYARMPGRFGVATEGRRWLSEGRQSPIE